MNKKLLIASLHQDEAITHCVLKHKKEFAEQVDIVLLPEILSEYEIFDELSDRGSRINWFKDSQVVISNQSHCLLNRVSFIPSALFNNFTPADRDYAKREFEAYLGYAFNSFIGIGNQTPNGICQPSVSLPQQWKRVSNSLRISVPEYYWGLKSLNNLHANTVYSNIYNCLNWKPNRAPENEEHIFCFQRPSGIPCFTACIGNQCFISDAQAIPAAAHKLLKTLTRKIAKQLNFFIAEMLFFIDEETITFGCVSADLIQMSKDKSFEAFVCNNLLKEITLCLH